MPARDHPAIRGRRAIRRALSDVTTDLRTTRLALGLSQLQVAEIVGVSRSYIGRLERDEIGSPRLEHLATFASSLGLRLRLALYPDGEPIRDRVQLRLLDAFHARIHPSLGWRTEVSLPLRNDRRAWDALATADDGWTAIEAITRLGAVDATLRATNQKQRDDPRIRRVVLVVADTARNRDALRLAVASIRAEYPLGSREVLSALASGSAPPLNGIVLMKIPAVDRPPARRPHVVHSGGKLVDAGGLSTRGLVENPVGGARGGAVP
jgi:transcriptional regulator with XRE-family HTH domain